MTRSSPVTNMRVVSPGARLRPGTPGLGGRAPGALGTPGLGGRGPGAPGAVAGGPGGPGGPFVDHVGVSGLAVAGLESAGRARRPELDLEGGQLAVHLGGARHAVELGLDVVDRVGEAGEGSRLKQL